MILLSKRPKHYSAKSFQHAIDMQTTTVHGQIVSQEIHKQLFFVLQSKIYEQFTKIIKFMNNDLVLPVFDAVASKTIPIIRSRHFYFSKSSFVASDVICSTAIPNLFFECGSGDTSKSFAPVDADTRVGNLSSTRLQSKAWKNYMEK